MQSWSRRPVLGGVLLFTTTAFAILVAPDGPPGVVAQEASVGSPVAESLIQQLSAEVAKGLRDRNIQSQFAQFRRYAASRLNATSGTRATSELTGNCRLSWYDHLLRNPEKSPAEAEQFTRSLHADLLDHHEGLDRALVLAQQKLDLGEREPGRFPAIDSPQKALDAVGQALIGSQAAYARAMAPLSSSEIGELTRNLYPVFVSQNQVGHTLQSRGTGRRLCDLLEYKLDRRALMDAAAALAPLADPALLEQLAGLPDEGSVSVPGATGTILKRITTPAGVIVVGGRDRNTYDLDKMAGLGAVVDLGGDDVYLEGTVSYNRPVLIVVDVAGDDKYRGKNPGIQGAAILGVSMLVDGQGNDVYQAGDMAQGSCLGGVGILIDHAGNDSYRGTRRLQGQAIAGVGLLIDRAGNDSYHAAMWDQGMGGPLGFAVLDDLDGADHYYTGGLYYDSYPETPGYEGWGQGVGAGPRRVADGGIGVILDGGGDDVYEFDYLAHGGGYWCGLGFARDFGGNDQRLGATRTTFNGGQRYERRFQRFGCGYGCHYALGFCFDDEGNDSYDGTIMGLGFAWDLSVGVLCDFGGDDQYLATGGGTQGNGAQAGLGILFDYLGDDVYKGYGQGNASASITYHNMPECGGNFSFVVDYGGEDKYGCGARNNTYVRRGSSGGFLIDRPLAQPTVQKDTGGKPSPVAAGS